MHRRLDCLFILLLATLTGAQQKPATPHTEAKTAASSGLPSEETVSAFLQQMFGYDPSLSWKIVSIKPAEAEGLAEVNVSISGSQGQQAYKFYVTADGRHAMSGEIIPFGAHPFEATRKELERSANGPSRGPADAAVTIVEFSDLQCPHCKDAQPTLDKLMAEAKNVRLVFQNFPLPGHDWAAKAAAYADCVGRGSNDAFWKFIASVYGAQSDITAANADEKLTGFADGAGVKGADIAACSAKPETTTRVEHSEKLGSSLSVNSTPTLFLNGRKLPAVPYEVLQKLVDFAAKEGK
jgi:protein-disulfide isomerase